MSKLRIELLGDLVLSREGQPYRPRTVQQALLLAHLALAEASIERNEVAARLWPEAERDNAMAYLRRALMELRRAGIEIETSGNRLALAPGTFATDVGDLLETVQGAFTLRSAPLLGIDHPAAESIRAEVESRLQARQRLKATPPPIEPKGVPDLILRVWESMLDSNPDAVAEAVAGQALALVAEYPSAPLLEITLRILEAGPSLGVPRVVLGQVAGRSAHIVTRYALAERLYRNAIADAEALGRLDLACQNLGTLAFLKMERREWGEARALGERSVAIAERAEDPAMMEGPLQNYAGVLWHLEEFEASAAHYRRAIAVSLPPKRIVPLANLAYLWGVFGVEPGVDFRPDLTSPTDGYRGLAESYLAFSCGMGDGNPVATTVAADRLLELTAASGMERLLAVAIDCAAMALARQGRTAEAAACVRVGSRVRRDLDHLRSPGERLAIRRNVPFPLFAPDVAEALAGIPKDSPERVGAALRGLLSR